jgi:hypothetical protein
MKFTIGFIALNALSAILNGRGYLADGDTASLVFAAVNTAIAVALIGILWIELRQHADGE